MDYISIYLDESGDLGFDWTKNRTSKYLVITLLVCEGKDVMRGVKLAVARTLKNKLNAKSTNKRHVCELKGSSTVLSVKQYFFNQMPAEGWKIYSVKLNKRRVNGNLKTRKGKKKLYNFLAKFIIDKIIFPEDLRTLNLVLDKCKNTEEVRDFNEYIENYLQASLPSLEVKLDVRHESSQVDKALQAVDLFCWGIARNQESTDDAWYKVFQHKIAFEDIYLR